MEDEEAVSVVALEAQENKNFVFLLWFIGRITGEIRNGRKII